MGDKNAEMLKNRPSLGLAMIAQNEEAHIPVSISQFYHVVDELVVVDGGSKDKTGEWAERMGARVIHRPFENDFSAQKNFAIEQLSTDWVYLHDPDERLEPPLLEILPVLVSVAGQAFLVEAEILPPSDKSFDCFGIARRNFIDGVQTEIYPDYQYRLFKNYCRFEGKVHEVITGFQHRTEIDYLRPCAAAPFVKERLGLETKETERGLLEDSVDITDTRQMSRFNILHYKSSAKQQEQDEQYRRIKGE